MSREPIGSRCPLCGQEYARKRIVDVIEAFDPVMDLSEKEANLSEAVSSRHVGLQCGHGFPRELFNDYEDIVEDHDRCCSRLNRGVVSGVSKKALEHYLEDVVEQAISELQAELNENAVAVEPEEDPYLKT